MQRNTVAILVLIVALVTTLAWHARQAEKTRGVITPPHVQPKPGAHFGKNEDEAVLSTSDPQRQLVSQPRSSEGEPGQSSWSRLVVHVRSREDGSPLALVRVSLCISDPHTDGLFARAYISGAQGDIEQSGTAFNLWAYGDNGVSCGQGHTDVLPLAPNERREVVIELPTGNDLHYFGRLLSDKVGSPIARGCVKAECVARSSFVLFPSGEPSESASSTPLTSSWSDSHGVFELWVPSWKPLDVTVKATGFSEALIPIAAGHDTRAKAMDILLSRSATLRARIQDKNGSPVPDGAIRLWADACNLMVDDRWESALPEVSTKEWRVDSDRQGLCLLEEAPSGSLLHVEIYSGGTIVKNDALPIILKPSEIREVEWSIGTGCVIEGLVTDQAGAPVGEHEVWLERAFKNTRHLFERTHNGEVILEASTDGSGRFSFKDLGPGKWWIGPAPAYHPADLSDPRAIAPVADIIEIHEAQQQQYVELHVQRGLYVRGSVVNSRGYGAAQVSVHGFSEDLGWAASGQTTADGSFALGPLAPGTYSLVAEAVGAGDAERPEGGVFSCS